MEEATGGEKKQQPQAAKPASAPASGGGLGLGLGSGDAGGGYTPSLGAMPRRLGGFPSGRPGGPIRTPPPFHTPSPAAPASPASPFGGKPKESAAATATRPPTPSSAKSVTFDLPTSPVNASSASRPPTPSFGSRPPTPSFSASSDHSRPPTPLSGSGVSRPPTPLSGKNPLAPFSPGPANAPQQKPRFPAQQKSLLRDLNNWYEWLGLNPSHKADLPLLGLAQEASRTATLSSDWEEKDGAFVHKDTGRQESTPPMLGMWLDRVNVQRAKLHQLQGGGDEGSTSSSDIEEPNSVPQQPQQPQQHISPQPSQSVNMLPPFEQQRTQPTQPQLQQQYQPQAVQPALYQAPATAVVVAAPVPAPAPAPAPIMATLPPQPIYTQPMVPQSQLMQLQEQYMAKIVELQGNIQTLTTQMAQLAQQHTQELFQQQSKFEAQTKVMQQQNKDTLVSMAEHQKTQEAVWQTRLDQREAEIREMEKNSENEKKQFSQDREKFAQLVEQVHRLVSGRKLDSSWEHDARLEMLREALSAKEQDTRNTCEAEKKSLQQTCELKRAEQEVDWKSIEKEKQVLTQREANLTIALKELGTKEAAITRRLTERESATESDRAEIARQQLTIQQDKEELMQLRSSLMEQRRALDRDRADFMRESMRLSDTGSRLHSQSQQVVFLHQQAVSERQRAEEMLKKVEYLNLSKLKFDEQQRAIDESNRQLQQEWARFRTERQQYFQTAAPATPQQMPFAFVPTSSPLVMPSAVPLASVPLPMTPPPLSAMAPSVAQPLMAPSALGMHKSLAVNALSRLQLQHELTMCAADTNNRQNVLDDQRQFLDAITL
eukprot:TRINITY_DN65_c0_g2_i3.p1 TRINITY_DN65_c0_g2~~TRINITY_DN65_c0_g2_i3.p1  ORF type:complete len:883 (-),score=220.69 TRINITY_DN65_c0_g2_i3:75-2561(-)